MTLAERLIAELQQEAVPTRRLLEHVPDDRLAWKPHAKSMSLGQLSYHIAILPRAIATRPKPRPLTVALAATTIG
jgi:hypothetical protein